MAKPQNLNDLISDLSDVFEDLKNDRVDHAKAKAMSDLAGRMIGAVNTQLQIIMVGGTEATPFMKGHTEPLRGLSMVEQLVTSKKVRKLK
jgi:hypothetical protein